jgi:hypothetical protein
MAQTTQRELQLARRMSRLGTETAFEALNKVRHYHEPRNRAPYSVDCVLRAQSEEQSVSE